MILFNFNFLPEGQKLPPVISFKEAKSERKFEGFCVKVSSLAEALCANAARADFIIPPQEIALQTAELAEFYLFDTKILLFVSCLEDLALAAALKADAAALCDDLELVIK